MEYCSDQGRRRCNPYNIGGDDGTRTHDPLLAKLAKPNDGESPRTIMAAQSHYVIVSE
jgi:hypothetical protein